MFPVAGKRKSVFGCLASACVTQFMFNYGL